MESRGEAGNSGHHPSSARTPAEQAGATSVRELTEQTLKIRQNRNEGIKSYTCYKWNSSKAQLSTSATFVGSHFIMSAETL